VFALIVLSGAALYFLKPDERKRLALAAADRLKTFIHAVRHGRGQVDSLHELMLARTRWLLVTPLLIAFSVVASVAAGFGDNAAMIDWGANYMPRTTNGEWWRLLAYTFVHGGVLHLLATIAALVSLGLVLERLVGAVAFGMTYVASGVVAAVVTLWTAPATTTTTGASAAIFGLYGLLAAVLVYGYVRQPRLPVSGLAARRLAAGAVIFFVYNLSTDRLGTVSELFGLATGLIAGFMAARGVVARKPRIHRSLVATAAVALLAVACALPLHGTIDARPTIARIIDVESRTASEYAKAVEGFTHGRVSAKALAQLIQRTILPALEADRVRVTALRGVPREQTALVTTAHQYFELRQTSWRTRAEGLLRSNMKTLREADRAERAALDQFERIQREVRPTPLS
jgi:membrane associated rhomboid family serine protease